MKLVPFVITQKEPNPDCNFHVYKWMLFLTHGGKGIWQTDESGMLSETLVKKEYLEPNGIVSKHIRMDKASQTAWIEVDPSQTKLSDFYSWNETFSMATKPECWRPFYFFKDKHGAYWWSGKGIECDAEIQGIGNVADCFEVILRTIA